MKVIDLIIRPQNNKLSELNELFKLIWQNKKTWIYIYIFRVWFRCKKRNPLYILDSITSFVFCIIIIFTVRSNSCKGIHFYENLPKIALNQHAPCYIFLNIIIICYKYC